MRTVTGYAALKPGATLESHTYQLPEIAPDQVDIKVYYCGISHSDLSMIHNDWGTSEYPLVPGHEIVGEIVALAKGVKSLKLGDKGGFSWLHGSCMDCQHSRDGSQNLCQYAEHTIEGR